MKATVTFNWNFDLEKGKHAGDVFVLIQNEKGQLTVTSSGYCPFTNKWLLPHSKKSVEDTGWKVIAWIDETDLFPEE